MAELPQPVLVDPNRLIENVFVPGNPVGVQDSQFPAELQDSQSRVIAEDYLRERYAGPPPEGINPSVLMLPKEVTQTRIGTHLVWPSREGGHQFRRWFNTNVAALLLLNAAINVDQAPNMGRDSVEAVQVIKDKIEDRFHIGEVCRTSKPGPEFDVKTKHSERRFISLQAVGSAEPKQVEVQNLVQSLLDVQSKPNERVTNIHVKGQASDFWHSNPEHGLGRADAENADPLTGTGLAADRRNAFMSALSAEAVTKGLILDNIETSFEEIIPEPEMLAALQTSVTAHGFKSIDQVLQILKTSPDGVPAELKAEFDSNFFQYQGVEVISDIETTVHVKLPDRKATRDCTPDGSPDKKHDYDLDLLPILIPPIPGLHKRPGVKTILEEVIIPGVDGEDEWLRIYEEAVNTDMTLKKEAWAYTRKYQAMFREDRIKNVYNMGYVDAQGENQTLRVLFADHNPEPETVLAFAANLQSFAQVRGGDHGHNLDAIVVYPEENAGVEGNEPKQIGLGIDYQSPRSVLGTAYYSLGLIEMHMPTDPTDKDLSDYFKAVWVFAHENGHFVDHNQEIARLSPIDSRAERHFVVSKQNAGLADTEFARLKVASKDEAIRPRTFSEFIRGQYPPSGRRWWLKRGLEDKNSVVHQLEHDDVADDDSRLKESKLIRVQNRFPTQYSQTNSAELWAESMAQAVTRIGLPFSEQSKFSRKNLPTDPRYATDYAIGTRTLKLIQDEVGSNPSSDYIEWPDQARAEKNWAHQMNSVENDPHLAPLASQARTWDFRTPEDERVLSILARARRTSRRPIK